MVVGEDWPSGDALGTLVMRWVLWKGEARRRWAGHFGDALGALEMRWALCLAQCGAYF